MAAANEATAIGVATNCVRFAFYSHYLFLSFFLCTCFLPARIWAIRNLMLLLLPANSSSADDSFSSNVECAKWRGEEGAVKSAPQSSDMALSSGGDNSIPLDSTWPTNSGPCWTKSTFECSEIVAGIYLYLYIEYFIMLNVNKAKEIVLLRCIYIYIAFVYFIQIYLSWKLVSSLPLFFSLIFYILMWCLFFRLFHFDGFSSCCFD